VTLLALYPLCQMKSLAALAPMSIVGVAAVSLTAAFMGIRYFDGTYAVATAAVAGGGGGAFLKTLEPALQPSFGTNPLVGVFAPTSLILGSMAATAFLVHFAAPDFYNNLRDNTPKRFATLTGLGFGVTIAITVLVMGLGFLTFGGNSAGMVLNNYSTVDAGAGFCRLLMAVNVIGSYPFVFRASKLSLMDILSNKGELSLFYLLTYCR
jgi:sodium-coupled neutral amino acid transporter 11